MVADLPGRRGYGLCRLIALVLLLGASWCQAAWMTATGRAEVVAGQYDLARQAARDDALRQLALGTQARVSSESAVEQGQLTRDRLNVRSDVQIRGTRILDEQVSGNMMTLTLAADVVSLPAATCAANTANGYRKPVAVLGFALQHPEQALIGQLQNVDRALSGVLTQALNERGHMLALEASHLRLYEDPTNAPARQTDRQTLTQALETAKHLGVQFVISGVVRNIGVRAPESFQRSAWNNALRGLGMRDTERSFEVELFVHDGFSGEVIYQQRYQTSGNWHLAPDQAVPFASAGFWRVEYGKAVQRLLGDLVADVDEHLRCLPFMTRITRAQGDLLQFNAGGNTGVRPGDELQVYRASETYDAQLQKGMELTDAQVSLKVIQVQPGFAQGRLEVDAGRVNIQADDVLIAW